MGAAYTQTGVLAKGRAKGSAGEIEELGRELGLAASQSRGRYFEEAKETNQVGVEMSKAYSRKEDGLPTSLGWGLLGGLFFQSSGHPQGRSTLVLSLLE